ncbi:hypothetical protein [Evansella cellulosilytica]|uniref:Uncharacterized protein n=1 Tax=Evansella cellulosilytica (strain ATCC 21833 / DSM 2522 / FERM P-1141 / JCM 9156 / N-4) TaxID=649639 RepID=E6U271_EVAC2|nr:hypothetical protein [Evansella cellulosilytica]ADU30449.1 hypothetical protein Bcell_2189 [Evansella cellulosilytica DSM 2522]
MGKWNEEAAPNLNQSTQEIKNSKFLKKKEVKDHEFTAELFDDANPNQNRGIENNITINMHTRSKGRTGKLEYDEQ